MQMKQSILNGPRFEVLFISEPASAEGHSVRPLAVTDTQGKSFMFPFAAVSRIHFLGPSWLQYICDLRRHAASYFCFHQWDFSMLPNSKPIPLHGPRLNPSLCHKRWLMRRQHTPPCSKEILVDYPKHWKLVAFSPLFKKCGRHFSSV